MTARLDRLLAEIATCRVCRDRPAGRPLPHEPRPVVRVAEGATLLVCGQAPGTRVHASGLPFDDASGERLRAWMGVSRQQFYDTRHIGTLPMGFCFPGQDARGGDLPPRRECAPLWRARLLAEMPQVRTLLLVGSYALAWHLPEEARNGLSAAVADWRRIVARPGPVRLWPLPHPSWRNTGWLKRHPWFARDLLPALRREVSSHLAGRCLE